MKKRKSKLLVSADETEPSRVNDSITEEYKSNTGDTNESPSSVNRDFRRTGFLCSALQTKRPKFLYFWGSLFSLRIIERPKFHYFWGSLFFLRIYAVCLAALILRSPKVLHCITLIFLRAMLDRTFLWGEFFLGSIQFQEMKSRVRLLIKILLRETDKTMKGDSLRNFVTAFGLKAWNTIGKSYFMSLVRTQCSGINNSVLKEATMMLERTNKLQQEMQERTIRITQEVQQVATRIRGR